MTRTPATYPLRCLLSLRRGLFPTFSAITIITALACSPGDNGSSAPETFQPNGSPSATQAPLATPPSSFTPLPAGSINDEPIAFQDADGVTLRGHLYSTAGPKRRVVIFVHTLAGESGSQPQTTPSDQTAWRDFAREIVGAGVATMTFDFPGHGETQGQRDVAKWATALQTAAGFMTSREYPLVYVVGAGAGGFAALKAAAIQDLSGVVAVSAPMSAASGLSLQADLPNIREPKLFLASRNDPVGTTAADITGPFTTLSPQPKQSMIFENGAEHGTDILKGPNAALFKQLVRDFVTLN